MCWIYNFSSYKNQSPRELTSRFHAPVLRDVGESLGSCQELDLVTSTLCDSEFNDLWNTVEETLLGPLAYPETCCVISPTIYRDYIALRHSVDQKKHSFHEHDRHKWQCMKSAMQIEN